ncbi:MAG TPA: PrsW family intramembrane metalloprotease [Anaerolineales bacterium]|nr:PrsW family intramembrane metalloprotease [Anaerolineales bacterium]
MGFLLSLFFGFVPMFAFAYLIYWLDRYEKEPNLLLGGVFIWGALVASGGAFLINTALGIGVYLFTGSEAATELTTGSLIAPFVEESLKGFAVLIVFLLFRKEFDSLLDGIVYAAVVALGFAATENTYYIYTYGFNAEGIPGLLFLAFVRVVLVGWQHPFYTAFTGIGLASARLLRSPALRLLAPVLGWTIAVIAHSLHNTLASFFPGPGGLVFGAIWDWTGWSFMFLFILWAIYRDQQAILRHLKEEVDLGLITAIQYRTACSAWAQSAARVGALLSGRYPSTNRFYQLCAELAHKKEQLLRLGEEGDNARLVESLRLEIGSLSPLIYPPLT